MSPLPLNYYRRTPTPRRGRKPFRGWMIVALVLLWLGALAGPAGPSEFWRASIVLWFGGLAALAVDGTSGAGPRRRFSTPPNSWPGTK